MVSLFNMPVSLVCMFVMQALAVVLNSDHMVSLFV